MKKIKFLFIGLLLNIYGFACTYTISLYDTYGDGWNGGTVTVTVNGVAVLSGITVASGYGPSVFNFVAVDGANVVITYTAGSWSSENEYTVYNQYNVAVVQSGQSGAVPSNTNFISSCPDPTCDDGIMNGDEEFIDCGGPDCDPCPQCANGVMDADEEGVDCGGINCPACPTDWNIDDVNGQTITTCTGTLYDSGGASGDYANSESYSVTFCSSDGGPMIINVSFNGEGCCDHIYVYDGPNTSSTQLADLIGDGSGTYSVNQLYISSGTCITIRWTSDGSVVYGGFIINVSCDMNEDPCTAWTLVPGMSCNSIQYTNLGVSSSSVPDPPCANYNGQDVWFVTTMPATGVLTALTQAGVLTDMGMAFYTGSNCNSLTFIECNDNNGVSPMPGITNTTIPPGSTVYIRVWDNGGDNEGSFSICLLNNEGPPPCDPGSPLASNDCFNATPICSFNGYCGNTSSAYDPQNVPSGFCGSVENNSWLSFVAAETEAVLNVWTSNCTYNDGIQMEIYSTTDCANFTSVSNCESAGVMNDFTIQTNVPLVVGQTYFLMIDGFGGDNCDYVIQAAEGVLTAGAIAVETNTDSVTICAGQPTPLLASGGTSYVWSPATGLDDPNSASPIATPTVTTTYTVTVTGGNPDCPGSDIASVVVYVGGAITATLSSTPAECGVCDGTATVETVTGQAPFTYLWDDSQTAQTAVGLCEGTIYVTITDTYGCVVEESVDVGNTGAVVAGFTVNTAAQCLNGNSFSFTNTGSNTGIESYSWDFGDGSTAVTQNASHSYASDGVYTVTQTVSYEGCVAVSTMDIEVFEHPTITFTPVDANCFGVCDGEITVNPIGGLPPYSDLWSNGQLTATATSLCPGSYNVTVVDANGCTVSGSSSISQPTAMVVTSDIVDVSCFGYSDGEIDLTINGGTPGYTVTWPSGFVGEDITGLPAGGYYPTITDANGCTDTLLCTINQPATYVSTTISGINIACYNVPTGSIDLSVNGGVNPYYYNWNGPSGYGASTQDILGLYAGTYDVTVTDGNGCTTINTITLTQPAQPLSVTGIVENTSCHGQAEGSINITPAGGTPTYSFIWSNAFSSEDIVDVTGGVYGVTVTDANGCIVTSSWEITEPAPVIAYPSASQRICIDGSATISGSATGGSAPYTYAWNGNMIGSSQVVSPTEDATYSLIVTDVNGCQSQPVTAYVYVYDSLKLDIFTSNPAICEGKKAVINGVFSGGMGGPYMITCNGEVVSLPMTVYPSETTNYQLIISDMCTTPEVMDEITITVYDLPEISFSPDIVKGCQPLKVNFTSWSNHEIEYYDWDFGDLVNNFSFAANPSHLFVDYGLFDISLTVRDTNGCVNTATTEDLITVYPLPEAAFKPSPAVASFLNPEIFFENQSYLADTSYWFFGDGDSTLVHSPLHTYKEIDEYLVELIVATQFGCRDTTTGKVIIRDEFTFYAPSAFTPSGTIPKNKFFYVVGNGISEEDFGMYIYDRWGELVYSTDKYSNETPWQYGWNGLVKENKLAASGVYTWLVIYRDENGIQHQEAGAVTLLR
ncbi:MAG: PKD domain-containing protein [Bacteroidales bacterium]|nr:PKD domain-containing protein [Bacteroidales bacterium]